MFKSRYADNIWKTLYPVTIPNYADRTREDLEITGVRLTGISKVDAAVRNSRKEVHIPIIKMVEYHIEGVPLSIAKRETLIAVNRDLSNYLEEWREYISTKFHGKIDSANQKLLRDLESFAKRIYEHMTAIELMPIMIPKLQIGIQAPVVILTEEEKKEKEKPKFESIINLARRNKRF